MNEEGYGIVLPVNSYWVLSRRFPNLQVVLLDALSHQSSPSPTFDWGLDKEFGARREQRMVQTIIVDWSVDKQGYGGGPKPIKHWQKLLQNFPYPELRISEIGILIEVATEPHRLRFKRMSLHPSYFKEAVRNGDFPFKKVSEILRDTKKALKGIDKYLPSQVYDRMMLSPLISVNMNPKIRFNRDIINEILSKYFAGYAYPAIERYNVYEFRDFVI